MQLQQSPFLSLVSDDRIRRAMLLMNQPADARLTSEIVRGVCARTDSAAVLEGSIAALGSQYVLGLRATTCASGDILADEQEQAARKEDVLNTLSQMATRFRTRVGESLATVAKHSMPLQDVTTPSLEALQAYSAGWKGAAGNSAAARQSATRALELGQGGREVEYAAAFALALAGDLPRARALAGDLAREFPEDTSVQFMYLPALRALFSLNTPAPDAAAAIQALQAASRYDLALGRIGFVGRFGGLYPIYVRGLAYFAARQPSEAAGEFQRILDHRSIVLVDPMDALARLQLARALALSGDTVKAKSAYSDLLTLWKHADPEIPIVKEARIESARLP